MRMKPLVAAVIALAVMFASPGTGIATPLQPLNFYTGGAAFSADGVNNTGNNTAAGSSGFLRVETAPNPTVAQAFLYNITFGATPGPADTATATLNGNPVTLSFAGTQNLIAGFDLSTFRADVTSIVAPLVNGGPGGIVNVPISAIGGDTDGGTSDGAALMVVYRAPSIPSIQSVGIIDGSQGGSGGPQNTAFALAGPLDKSVPGFNAILSVGINFSFQGGASAHACGSGAQFSLIDVNGTRLSSCAGNFDDGSGANGGLITIGGVGDSTDNPADPNCSAGSPCASGITDDELYDVSSFLNQGDTSVFLTTFNPSNDDALFVSALQLSAEIANVCQVNCDLTPVPEPGTLLLLGASLAGVAGVKRYFRKP